MENGTKALLIAAAVLIAIVLISLGVSIFGSSNDASSQARNVTEQLSNTTGKAKEKAVEIINHVGF